MTKLFRAEISGLNLKYALLISCCIVYIALALGAQMHLRAPLHAHSEDSKSNVCL